MVKRILKVIARILEVGIITTITFVAFLAILDVINPKLVENEDFDDDE